MDIDLTRTFLEIVRSGSFIAAAERLHVTQTAVTARIQKLEGHLNCTLFVRNRAGAKLTADGEAFVAYANQILQTWEAAQRDLPLPDGYHNVIHVGGEVSLCNPLMLRWVSRIRAHIDQYAVHTHIGDGQELLRQLELGVLDAALVYQPNYWPGMQVEQLLEEKLILVRAKNPEPYVYVDWGEAFRLQHDSALPDRAKAPVSFNLGRWPCSTSSNTAALATSAREWCRATWTRRCSNACPVRPSSATRPTWCTPGSATRQCCSSRSICCARSLPKTPTGRSAGTQ